MLIVNNDQLCRASIVSLEERCHYCSKTLAAYPLIMSDDAKQTVYHVTCALELATDLMVDLYTFFSPPAPYPQLFVLTAPEAVSSSMPHSERVQTEGVAHAVNEYRSNQKGPLESSLPGEYPRSLPHGASGSHQATKGATSGDDPRLGALVSGGERQD